MARTATLPENALKLFRLYAADAPNWGGTPLVGGNVTLLGAHEDRGLLTHLKRAGLVRTWTDDGASWLAFTEKGEALIRAEADKFNQPADTIRVVGYIPGVGR